MHRHVQGWPHCSCTFRKPADKLLCSQFHRRTFQAWWTQQTSVKIEQEHGHRIWQNVACFQTFVSPCCLHGHTPFLHHQDTWQFTASPPTHLARAAQVVKEVVQGLQLQEAHRGLLLPGHTGFTPFHLELSQAKIPEAWVRSNCASSGESATDLSRAERPQAEEPTPANQSDAPWWPRQKKIQDVNALARFDWKHRWSCANCAGNAWSFWWFAVSSPHPVEIHRPPCDPKGLQNAPQLLLCAGSSGCFCFLALL